MFVARMSIVILFTQEMNELMNESMDLFVIFSRNKSSGKTRRAGSMIILSRCKYLRTSLKF